MRGRGSVAIDLGIEERGIQEARLCRHKAARPLSDRCRIVLRCADGPKSKAAAAEPGHSEHGVGKWRRRFAECRIEGLSDEYRAGRRAGCAMRRWRMSSRAPWRPRRRMPPIGRSVRWPRSRGYRIQPFAGSGPPSARSRIAARRSGFRPIRCSSTWCRISPASHGAPEPGHRPVRG